MEKFKAEAIVKATGGLLVCGSPKTEIQQVVIDSRQAKPGTVFFAIVGEVQDGHIYAENAAAAGADILVVHDPAKSESLRKSFPQLTVILVKDTTRALQDLAVWYLSLFSLKKIAVTGSTGKTTTKEMLYAIFSQKYKTLKTSGNFNNHIGLPLTIFRLEKGIEVAVFEMGMSEFGEIDRLADIVRPDMAVITNVGTSHIENLKTRENILKAKLEITNYLQPSNVLIVNRDNDMLTPENIHACIEMKKQENPEYSGDFTLFTAGEHQLADLRLSDRVDRGEAGITFSLERGNQKQAFTLPLLGNHNGFNAMLAVAAGSFFGISMEEAAAGLRSMENAGRRLHIEDIHGIKLLDDTYNASPDSCMAAIDVLMSVEGKRKIAILADILEMGGAAEEYHRKVGAYAAEKEVDVLIAIGQSAAFYASGAECGSGDTAVIYHETKEPLLKKLGVLLQPGDVVLVKGSNGMKMTEVTDRIRSL